MIKHLAPRSEKEIDTFIQEEIIQLAKTKLPQDHKKIYANYCSVFVTGNDITHKPLWYRYSIIYKVTFSRKGFFNKWKFCSLEKISNSLMNKNWYTTQLTAEREEIKRPYD